MTDTIVFPGTLADALQSDLILPGSRLSLRGGNYLAGDLECRLTGVTITAYPNETPVLIPASGMRVLFFGQYAQDVILDGLTIDASNITNHAIGVSNGAQNITIKNCEIKNAPGQGILITHGIGTTTGTIVENCHIHHCGSTGGHHGIYIRTGGTIRSCNIHDISGYGVHAYESVGDYTVERCYIHDNSQYGVGALSGNATIINNVIRRNAGSNIRASYNLLDLLIAFNTCDSNLSGYNIAAGGRTTDDPAVWRVLNNVCVGPGWSVEMGEVENNLNLSVAEFSPASDDGAGNYKPLTGNPAIGAGVAITGITTDYAGTARANPPTIGAYEA